LERFEKRLVLRRSPHRHPQAVLQGGGPAQVADHDAAAQEPRVDGLGVPDRPKENEIGLGRVRRETARPLERLHQPIALPDDLLDLGGQRAGVAQGDPRGRLIDELRRQVGQWEASRHRDEATFSSGTAGLDRLLPSGSLRYGMLTEWLSGLARCGAATLSLLAAREACRPGGVLVVIDRRQTFYPPAAAAWGIDLRRLIIVHPQSARDELWAAVQALRSPAVAAMWAMIDRLDSRAFRRLQLAAQAGRTLGLLLRPGYVRGQPSWADVRLWVGGKMQNAKCKMQIANWQASAIENLQFRAPPVGWPCNLQSSARRVQVRIMRCHSGRSGGSVTLEIDDATHTVREVSSSYDAHPLPVVPELADPTIRSLSSRA